MTFKKLAQYFEQLEKTPSRNSMVEILSRLFQEARSDEIDKVVYLTQGRVAPLYEPVEFQMAEKTMIRAMALAYGKPVEKITELYKKSGDLGETAQQLNDSGPASPAKRGEQARMTVEEAFNKLTEITRINGEGSVEKKVNLLAEILKGCSPVSARVIARIPVDKLRLGFSDMTVLEGLSWMVCGSKKLKDELEAGYNVRPDLGYIAKQVKIQNVAERKISARSAQIPKFKIQPVLGTPILVMRAERLTTPEEILEKTGGKCAVEPKLDGLRTQLHYRKGLGISIKNQGGRNNPLIRDSDSLIQLFSRGLENVTAMYPDLVKAAGEELDCDEVILDGEAIGFDSKTGKYLPFQETVQRKRKHEVEMFSQNVPLQLVVFDCLFYNGESLINKPYTVRRTRVQKVLKSNKIIVVAEQKIIADSAGLEDYFKDCIRKGLEGIVAKKLDGVYEAGARGWSWIKYKKSYSDKLSDTVDAVVMGVDYGQGKRNKFGVGAFLIGVYDPKTQTYKTISKVGTGLTDEEWRALKVTSQKSLVNSKPKNYDVNKLMTCDQWLMPVIVGEFKADELTKSPMHTAGYALRFPRLVRWREKQPQDSTSLQEVIKLAKLK